MKRLFGIIVLGLILASCGSDSSSSAGASSSSGSSGSLGSDNACVKAVAEYVAYQMQYQNNDNTYTLTYDSREVEYNTTCGPRGNCRVSNINNVTEQQNFTDTSYMLEDIINAADTCTTNGVLVQIETYNQVFIINRANILAANPVYVESWSGKRGSEGTVVSKNLLGINGGNYKYYDLGDLFKKLF